MNKSKSEQDRDQFEAECRQLWRDTHSIIMRKYESIGTFEMARAQEAADTAVKSFREHFETQEIAKADGY